MRVAHALNQLLCILLDEMTADENDAAAPALTLIAARASRAAFRTL